MARFSRQVCHWTYAVTLLAVSNAFVVPCSRIVTKKRIHTRNINSPQLLTFVDELQKYASKDSNCEGFGMKNGIKRIFSKQSITSLQTEGLRVHSAFPKLLKGAFRFALGRVGVIMMFTAFSYIISPYFGRQVLTQLVNILIALSHMTSNIVSGLFFFPIACSLKRFYILTRESAGFRLVYWLHKNLHIASACRRGVGGLGNQLPAAS